MSGPFRVAVVGSGPAGFYAAAALLDAQERIEVDMIERLPTPWGLVRLGVAPDHPKLKSVSRAFERIAEKPGFRFFGNVEVGRDASHADLVQIYDAVIYAFGAQSDKRLGIPGEELPGSWSATEFVAWYNGHPDYQELPFDLNVERAVVIGNGNVALDVARMLALTPEELAPTDTTDPAIDAIGSSTLREIVVAPRMTWLLVSTSPDDVRTIPVPAAAAFWYARFVSMSTTPVVTGEAARPPARATPVPIAAAAAAADNASLRIEITQPV